MDKTTGEGPAEGPEGADAALAGTVVTCRLGDAHFVGGGRLIA